MKIRIIYFFVFCVLYIALQIIGALLEFLIFGSGDGINGYRMLIPYLMLMFQILLMFFIRFNSKISFFKKDLILFFLSVLIPVLMFFKAIPNRFA